MNARYKKTLINIFKTPLSKLLWTDIENLFQYLGAKIQSESNSRVSVKLNGIRAHFHLPYPNMEIDRKTLISIRKFLVNAGVEC